MFQCRKCQGPLEYPQPVKLLGSLLTQICINCANNWHVFIVESHYKYFLLENKLRGAINLNVEGDITQYSEELFNLEKEIYKLSVEWLKS